MTSCRFVHSPVPHPHTSRQSTLLDHLETVQRFATARGTPWIAMTDSDTFWNVPALMRMMMQQNASRPSLFQQELESPLVIGQLFRWQPCCSELESQSTTTTQSKVYASGGCGYLFNVAMLKLLLHSEAAGNCQLQQWNGDVAVALCARAGCALHRAACPTYIGSPLMFQDPKRFRQVSPSTLSSVVSVHRAVGQYDEQIVDGLVGGRGPAARRLIRGSLNTTHWDYLALFAAAEARRHPGPGRR